MCRSLRRSFGSIQCSIHCGTMRASKSFAGVSDKFCPMPNESGADLPLEIGHVLFLDIVGYSKLLIEEQKERLNQFTQIVLATGQVRESTDEQLVRLPTG